MHDAVRFHVAFAMWLSPANAFPHFAHSLLCTCIKPEAKEKFAQPTRPTHRWCLFLCFDSLSKERPLPPLPLLLKKKLWCFLLMPLSVRLDRTIRLSHVACIHGNECRLTDTAGFGCVFREPGCLLDVFHVNKMCALDCGEVFAHHHKPFVWACRRAEENY